MSSSVFFRRAAGAACGLALTLSASALPAERGVWRSVRLADGQTRLLQTLGDEHFHYFADVSGQLFARRADGHMEPLDGQQLSAAADVMAPLRAARAAQRAAARHAALPGTERHAARRSPQTGDPTADLHGQRRGLVVMVEFADVKFAEGHTAAFYNRLFNESGFAEEPFYYSVRDYFLEQSRGQFDMEFDVVGPVCLSHEAGYYGENIEISTLFATTTYERRVSDFAMEATQLADPLADFSLYDWDGDGTVEQVCFLYAGRGEATGGPAETIWPVESSLSAMAGQPAYFPQVDVQLVDGVKVDAFSATNEMNNIIGVNEAGRAYYTDELRIAGIGAFCHEFGHCLGLPDFYYSSSSPMGYWDIMDSGSHLDGGYRPCAFTAYERWFCGWQTPVELDGTTQVENMAPLTDGGQTYVFYYDNPDRTEYCLFENRQPIGTDAAIYGHGLLVSHVDYDPDIWAAHTVNRNTSDYHQRMTMMHANRTSDNSPEASAGHLYPFEGKDSITINNYPRFAQFNGANRSTTVTDRAIRHITEYSDRTMSFLYEYGEQVDYSAIAAPASGHGPALRDVYDLSGRPVPSSALSAPAGSVSPSAGALHGVFVTAGRKAVVR